MKGIVVGLCTAALLAACSSPKSDEQHIKEDIAAKEMLQGIWLDDETDMPIMRIEDDTIYYANPLNAPVAFKIISDSIYLCGSTPVMYKIERQTENTFWFHALEDEVVKLNKSENSDDSLAFSTREVEVISTAPEVIKKDRVVMYNGTRYRGYVYINPSQIKVIRTSYSEDGINVDNVYYDNVIHICVYEGKKLLYGKDITKQLFANVFSDEELSRSVLLDMNFLDVNSRGYHYQATLGIPESPVYNLVDVFVGFDQQLTMKKAE